MSAGVKASRFNDRTTLKAIEATVPGLGDRLGAQAVDRLTTGPPTPTATALRSRNGLPGSGLLEVAYVGNRSAQLLNDHQRLTEHQPGAGGRAAQARCWRPQQPQRRLRQLPSDGGIPGSDDHQLTACIRTTIRCRSTWLRTKGRYNINLNYTYGKSLGIVRRLMTSSTFATTTASWPAIAANSSTSPTRSNWATPSRATQFAKGIVNGWQISGITQIQSGVNLTGNTGYNYNLDTGGYQDRQRATQCIPRSINGTDSIALRPLHHLRPVHGLEGQPVCQWRLLLASDYVRVATARRSKPVYGPDVHEQ